MHLYYFVCKRYLLRALLDNKIFLVPTKFKTVFCISNNFVVMSQIVFMYQSAYPNFDVQFKALL